MQHALEHRVDRREGMTTAENRPWDRVGRERDRTRGPTCAPTGVVRMTRRMEVPYDDDGVDVLACFD